MIINKSRLICRVRGHDWGVQKIVDSESMFPSFTYKIKWQAQCRRCGAVRFTWRGVARHAAD